ncbi:MAG TPA: GDSL-type esterase/lipase family protein [Trebonia sp.]|nr:GDSL-type esterase/lipase family protein [Trebonia sp.]
MTRTAALYLVTLTAVSAGAIWLALRVAPLQTVSAAGQTAQVGATLPNASVRGPGELDLFGQVMATRPDFPGPIRPRLALEHITIDPQVIQMLRADGPSKVALTLSQQLAAGWERYFLWETLIAAGFAVIPLVAIAAVRRRPKIWKLLAGGIAVVVAVNAGGIALTASGTPRVLRSVKTLDDLVGVDPLTGTVTAGAAQPGVQAVVIGDSTASGWGLPWGTSPTALDQACGRSPESYAADLAAANQWNVLNLACGSATIENGLLGPEVLYNGQVAPPQLPLAAAATHARLVVVSVGADDLSWSVMTQLCAAQTVCDDKVSSAYFTQLLNTFTRNYYQLLSQLDGLPAHPAVLVNLYYSPFGSNLSCLSNYGMLPGKVTVLLARLGQLNTVLRQGAGLFGFGVAAPRFTGHELCTADPWVQGPADPAPLHPNAAGDLAIALADEQAFPLLSPSPVALPSVSPSPPPSPATG